MNKEELRMYIPLKREVTQLREQLEELESRIYSPRVPVLTGMPSAPRFGGGSAQEINATKTMELRELYQAKLKEIDGRLYDIETAIAGLTPTFRALLRYKYIEGLTWEEVCVKMDYSWRQIHRLHSQALQELKDVA